MMFSFASIYKAYKSCLKYKSNTQNALHFQVDILQNLHTLSKELQTKRYTIGKSICFLTHSPKLREIFAANFKDRVVHHVLVDDFVLFHEDRAFLLHVKRKTEKYLAKNLHLSLREDSKLKLNKAGLDFLGYIIKPTHTLVRKRVVNNFKYKKAKFLTAYETKKGKMPLEEIKEFLSVQASFLAHTKWANSYRLNSKLGVLNEEKYSKLFNTLWAK